MTRSGDFIRTFSGIRFWPLDPLPEEVSPEDIAHALALKVRWQGHCKHFYSVGMHSLRVARVAGHLAFKEGMRVMPTYAYGLLHDAAEAYLPDVPTPVKPFIAEWKSIEGRVESAILTHFNLPPMPPEIKAMVKRADRILLKIESTELFDNNGDADWPSLENIEVTNELRASAEVHSRTIEGTEYALADELKLLKYILSEKYENSSIPFA